MAEIRTGEADPGEREAIIELTVAAYQEFSPTFAAEDWAAYSQNIVSALTDLAGATQLVAKSDGVVVGAVLLCPAGAAFEEAQPSTCPEIRLLAVAEAARGLGIGKQLMRDCIERARAQGDQYLILHTMEQMAAAKVLYQRLGFVRTLELDFRPRPWILAEGYQLAL